MQKVTIYFIAALLFLSVSGFVNNAKEKIKWMSVVELQAAYNKNPRPVLVDIYTDWCGWCKVMDRDTYGNDKVAAYINEHYYAVKFDAETKDSVQWGNRKFGYNAAYKVNELSIYFTGGQLSYPTTVFLSLLDAQPAPLAGYLKPKEMEPPLKYFGDGVYKEKNFPEFIKSFKAAW